MSDEPERWRNIDASRPEDEVHADVLSLVQAARNEVTTA